MPLKNRNNLTPGGWLYEQKETGFKLRSMSPLMEAAKELAEHRQANKLTRPTIGEAADDIDAATCNRLGYDPAWCFSADTQKKIPNLANLFQAAASHVRGAVQRAGESFSKLDTGRAILNAWVGEGLLPVDTALAQARADICTGRIGGNPCRWNEKGAGLEAVTKPIAQAIKAQMEKKHEMKAVVVGEENLFTCSGCWCDLNLKPWTPLKTILDRTPKAMLDKFASEVPHCWIIQEQKHPET
jgi:hypothetical protein